MYNPIKKLNQVKLSSLNFYAFLLHLLSAIGIGVYFLASKKEVQYNTDLYTYKLTSIDPTDPKIITFGFGDGLGPKIDVSGLALKLIIVFIFLITAVFHFFYYTNYKYYKEVLGGRNRYRWIEYGITATISFGIVAVLNYKAYRKKGYDFSRYERYYILLSYFSKAFMGYYLTFGLSRDAPEKNS